MQILEYHVFAGDAYEESDFDDHSTLHMAEGETVKVNQLGCVKHCLMSYTHLHAVTLCMTWIPLYIDTQLFESLSNPSCWASCSKRSNPSCLFAAL